MGRAHNDKIWVLKRDGVEIASGKTQEEIALQTGIGKSVISAIFRGTHNSNLTVDKLLIPRENVYIPKRTLNTQAQVDKWCVSQRGDRYQVHPYFSEEVVTSFLQSISSYLGRPVDGYMVISIHDTYNDAIQSLNLLERPTPTPTVEATLFDRREWLDNGEYHEWTDEFHTCQVCGRSGKTSFFHNRHHDKCNGIKLHKSMQKRINKV